MKRAKPGIRARKLQAKIMARVRTMRARFKSLGHDLPVKKVQAIITNPWTCAYCDETLTWKTFSIDHKIPISRGGTNQWENFAWASKACNLAKGDLTGEEYMDLVEFMACNLSEHAQKSVNRRLRMGAYRFGR